MVAELKQLLSRPLLVQSVPDEGLDVTVEANAAERAALARHNDIVEVALLTGRFRVRPERSGGGFDVTGTVAATVTQTCTVSLDPFESTLSEAVDMTFLPERGLEAWRAKYKPKADEPDSMDDDDPPDAIVDGRIDLGAVTAEALSLGLDPYPRKPGVAFEPDPAAAERDPSPFAALAKLKRDP